MIDETEEHPTAEQKKTPESTVTDEQPSTDSLDETTDAQTDVTPRQTIKPRMLSRTWIAQHMPPNDLMVAFGTFLLAAATAWLVFIASKTDEATHELARHYGAQVAIINAQLEAMKAANAQTEKLIKATQDSVDVAKRALAIGQRPWVYPELTISGTGLGFVDGNMTIEANLILRNVGNSPALNVTFDVTAGISRTFDDTIYDVPMAPSDNILGLFRNLFIYRRGPPESAKLLRDFCNQFNQRTERPGDAIFPDRESTRPVFVSMKPNEVKRTAAELKYIRPIVVVCLNYRSAADPVPHQTGFIFALNRKDKNFIALNKGAPADQVEFKTLFDAGSVAD